MDGLAGVLVGHWALGDDGRRNEGRVMCSGGWLRQEAAFRYPDEGDSMYY